MKKYILLCTIIVLLVACIAEANAIRPLKFWSRNSSLMKPIPIGIYPQELCAIVFEALIISLILYYLDFNPLRMFCVWLPITFFTFLLLLVFIGYLAFFFGWTNINEVGKLRLWNIQWLIIVFIGEYLVILYEALALRWLSLSSFFSQYRSSPLEPWKAFAISVLVNIASFFVGFSFFYVYQTI